MSRRERPATAPRLAPGDHTPQFVLPDTEGKTFEFYSAVTGRPVVMIFAGPRGLTDLAAAGISPATLDATKVQVVTLVPGDPQAAARQARQAGWTQRTLADPNGEVTQGFAEFSGVTPPAIYVLDPNQRVSAIAAADQVAGDFAAWIDRALADAAFRGEPAVVQRAAPVLLVPRALEPEDCDWLIGLWRRGEKEAGQVAVGASSGGGLSVVHTTKRREDYYIRDPKNLHFDGFALETFKIGCYKAEQAGFFNVHRDDTSPATKNRKFAMTLNLNTGEYEGGDLRFPEYGPDLYRPPKGAAVLFSCSMLHEVVPVTKGERFVLLTFLITPPGR